MPVGIRFSEALEGAFRLRGSPREGRMRLVLDGEARLSSVWRGEPVEMGGTVVALGWLPETRVAGVLAFERRTFTFSYRFVTVSPPEPVHVLSGQRTFRGDAYAGLTTLALAISEGDEPIGDATLRLDARGGPRTIAGMRVSWA